MNDFSKLDQLLERVSKGEADDMDFQNLRAALSQGDDAVVERIHAFHQMRAAADPAYGKPYDTALWQDIVQGILSVDKHVSEPPDQYDQPVVYRIPHTRRWAAAAAILILVSAAYLYLLRPPAPHNIAQQPAHNEHDVLPGGNKAILTLSDGRQIILDSAAKGTLATQGSTQIIKTDSGKLKYQSGEQPPATVTFNTLTTPRGGQYQLTLPDGTKVWLNAASSITYPISFMGKNRVVSITGEAYFEVIHRATQPFQVKVKDRTIEDIGTHFNINAYDDEPDFRTTLIEGSVSISNAAQKVILKPGEQAIISPEKASITVTTADLETVMAWKNGLFKFTNTPIDAVMRQLSRWYNVDVEYPSGIPKTTFTGEMQREVNASQVLDILSYFKIHFRIENGANKKTIAVLP